MFQMYLVRLSDAKTSLLSSGLKIGDIHKVSSDTVAEGYVVKTESDCWFI